MKFYSYIITILLISQLKTEKVSSNNFSVFDELKNEKIQSFFDLFKTVIKIGSMNGI